MSETENRESAPAPQGEAIAATPIAMDSGAAAQAAPAAPKPVRIADSSFEAAHADLPPLSTLGDSAPAVITESSAGAANTGGPRRGRGRGAPAGGKFGAPTTTKTPIGAIEDPADMTESLTGKYVSGYTDAPKSAPRREQPPAEATAPEATVERTVAATPATPGDATAPVIKEFVPPVSEGTFKAELNPEAERKAREERRQQREQRPQGERPARDQRPQGGEFRGNREQGEQRPRGDRPERGDRPDRQDRPERQDRGERAPRGDQTHRNGGDNRRGERPNRPGRLTIEAPQIPVQEELSFFGKIKRFISEKIWGVPAANEVEYKSVSHKPTPHSREWQFGRNQGGQERAGRGEFRHGNHRGGDNRGNPNRDGRHRPHARGGNHRDQHGRDGNPRG